jgi:hypothetical protein
VAKLDFVTVAATSVPSMILTSLREYSKLTICFQALINKSTPLFIGGYEDETALRFQRSLDAPPAFPEEGARQATFIPDHSNIDAMIRWTTVCHSVRVAI